MLVAILKQVQPSLSAGLQIISQMPYYGVMEQQAASGQPVAVPSHRSAGLFSGQRKVYIAVALLALAVGYFGFAVFQGATVYYYTVDELLASADRDEQVVRVAGKLLPDSFQRDAQGTVAHFSLSDGQGVLPAAYDGILPELFFNEASQIVLEGKYEPGGVFQTNNVVVKCPSKYQAEGS